MEIIYFESIGSTQKELIKDIKEKRVSAPIAYYSHYQTDGIGSRGNSWIGERGNLFFSFAMQEEALPKDLPKASISLYFMYLLKELLSQKGSLVWLKWPNDLYIGQKKCGGCITNFFDGLYVCGIGLNTKVTPNSFGKLDIEVDAKSFLQEYLQTISSKISWKQIFSKYSVEFQKNRKLSVHINGEKVSLNGAKLAEDGALIIGNERIYSLR